MDKFILLSDFVILDRKVNTNVSIILDRLFLAPERSLVDVERGDLRFLVNGENVVFNICKTIKKAKNLQ